MMIDLQIIKSKKDVQSNVQTIISYLQNDKFHCGMAISFRESIKGYYTFKPRFGGNTTGSYPVYNYDKLTIYEITKDGDLLVSWKYGSQNSYTHPFKMTIYKLEEILWKRRKEFNDCIRDEQRELVYA